MDVGFELVVITTTTRQLCGCFECTRFIRTIIARSRIFAIKRMRCATSFWWNVGSLHQKGKAQSFILASMSVCIFVSIYSRFLILDVRGEILF